MIQPIFTDEKKLIHLEREFLRPEACDYLVTAFEGLHQYWRNYRNTVTINYNDLPITSRSKRILNQVRLSIATLIRERFGDGLVYANLTQIVKWPTGSEQPFTGTIRPARPGPASSI